MQAMRLIRTASPDIWPFIARVSRGRWGVVLVVGLLAMMVLPGCSETQPPADMLVVAQKAEPHSLDRLATSALDDFRIQVNIYEGLLAYRPGTLEPVPALAHSWKISNGGRDYTFRLKSGVRFHVTDPDTLLYGALRCGTAAGQAGLNGGYYCNAEVDGLMEQARLTSSKLRRTSLYRELARTVHSDAPWIEVASRSGNLVALDRVRGLKLEPSSLLDLSVVWKQR